MRDALSTTDEQDLDDLVRVSRARKRREKAPNVGFAAGKAAHGNRASRLARARPHLAVPDPCMTDRIYTDDENELLAAITAYKARTGRQYPTHCEVLAVAKELGYRKP